MEPSVEFLMTVAKKTSTFRFDVILKNVLEYFWKDLKNRPGKSWIFKIGKVGEPWNLSVGNSQ